MVDSIANLETQTIEITVLRCMNVSPDLAFGFIEKKRDYFIKVTLGSTTKETKNCRRLNQQLEWNEKLIFPNTNASYVTLSLHCRRILRDPKLVQQLNYPIFGSAGAGVPFVRATTFSDGPQMEFSLKVLVSPAQEEESMPSSGMGGVRVTSEEPEIDAAAAYIVPQAEDSQGTSEQVIDKETKSHNEVGEIESQAAEDSDKAYEAVEQVKQALKSQHNPKDGWKRLLQGIESFRDITGSITEAHPYAKLAHTLLFAIPGPLIEQLELDEDVQTLFDSFASFCDIVDELKDSDLSDGGKLGDVLKRIGLQMTEVAYFVRDYCKKENFLKRALKNKITSVSDVIEEYHAKIGELKSELHTRLVVQTSKGVARTEIKVVRVLKELESFGQSVDLNDIPYVPGAGLNTDRCCLEGTREKFLEEIEDWVNSDDSRTLLIFGGAGTGKSSIAHTIAERFRELGRLGCMFCFSESESAKRNPTSVFSHISRDLADLDLHIRFELAKAVQDKADRTTAGIAAQFDKLILTPLNAIRDHLRGPVIIVIDALDESGPVPERGVLLRVLAKRLKELPANFRFIITSRPDPDIEHAFKCGSDILIKRMDAIPHEHTAADISMYVKSQFADGRYSDIDDTKCEKLASHANGVFQWVSVACQFIQAERIGETAVDRYEELLQPLAHNTGDKLTGDNLLDKLYRIVLSKVLSLENKTAVEKFKFVMARVLTAFEPLSSRSLNKLAAASKMAPRNCKAEGVVAYLGSLLSGTHDEDTPIRPLHTSFRNFLANSTRSKEFFVDLSAPDIHLDMVMTSMQIMTNELTFNICRLGTSHLPNKKVPGIEESMRKYIPRHLSYTCRFWAAHLLCLRVTNPNGSKVWSAVAVNFWSEIMKEIHCLFSARLLYYMEVLSFENAIGPAIPQMRTICEWLKDVKEDESIISLIEDGEHFMSYFARCIGTSAPHIYISALPFTPKNSLVATNYSQYCSRTLVLASGRSESYPSWPHILHGHTRTIGSVGFSPDGTRIISGSWDKTIRVWNVENGEMVIGPLKGHTGGVCSVAFSPDGTRIVSGSEDNTIRVWDAENGEMAIGPLKGHTNYVLSVGFSPDGTHIISGSLDNTIRVWSAGNGKVVIGPLKGHTAAVRSVGYSPDGTRIVSGSWDNTIRVWNTENGEMTIGPLQGHTNWVNSVGFSPDGTRIVSGSSDKTIRVWDAENGKMIIGPLEGHTNQVWAVVFSPDGTRIISGSMDCTIRVWNAENDEIVVGPLTGHADSVFAVGFSPDGNRIVSGSADATIRVWDVASSETPNRLLSGHTNSITSVGFSPDGTRIVSGSKDNTIRVWNAENGEMAIGPLKGHTNWVRSVRFSPDGTRIVSGSDDNTIRVWDAETGTMVIGPLKGHAYSIFAVEFSPDGTRIVSGSRDKTIRVWDAANGKIIIGPLKGHTGTVFAVGFSPDGTRVISGSEDGTIRVWNAENGEMIIGPLQGHTNYILSVGFSPDGTRIVSCSWDNTIRVWNAHNGEMAIGPLKGHTDYVYSVGFSPDGTRLVSSSKDTTVRLWDATNGDIIAEPLQGHTGAVISVAFSPDGTRIVSGSQDYTIRLYSIPELRDLPNNSFKGPTLSHASHVGAHADNGGDRMPRISPGDCDLTQQLVLQNHWHMEDGWALGRNGELLFYVPPAHWTNLYHPTTIAIMGTEIPTKLDMTRFVHGTRWTECFEDGATNNDHT